VSAAGGLPAEVWTPSEARRDASAMAAFQRWLRERGIADTDTFAELWTWSTEHLERFWECVWDFFEVQPPRQGAGPVLRGGEMPHRRWFPEETLNFAENALRHPADRPAVIAVDEQGGIRRLSYGELREQVAAAAAGLRSLGVGPGDRVAAILSNREEALIAMLASASVGAIWTLCATELGTSGILSRLQQVEPKLLIAADAYAYQGKVYDLGEKVREVRAGLPTLEHAVTVRSDLVPGPSDALVWADLLAAHAGAELAVEPVPFEHPLWILYSSGTTGIPKAMLQSHGGITLELLKNLALHVDIGPESRFFWYTTTAWMMWNYLVSGLLTGAAVVLYDGPPKPEIVWPFADRIGVTVFGASPGFFQAGQRAGLPATSGTALRTVGSTGSPLTDTTHRWMAETFGDAVQIASISGGTDICSAFVGPNPLEPVVIGRIQNKMLGVACYAYDEHGRAVVDQIGELVITQPIPSMPIRFWGDADGSRMHDSYFAVYPGVWRHGDWISFDAHGSAIIHGRSDSTLNRGGVRTGTSEFYRVLDGVDGLVDALIIDTSSASRDDGELVLFVVLDEAQSYDDALRARIRSAIGRELSPRHLPDRIVPVADIPYTLTGKKSEVPVKRMMQGVPAQQAVDVQSLRNPESLASLLAAAAGAAPTP